MGNGSIFYEIKLNGLLTQYPFGAKDVVVPPEKKMSKARMAIAWLHFFKARVIVLISLK